MLYLNPNQLKGLSTTSLASGLYYKYITIVNDDSSVVSKFEASPTDNARVVIYDGHMCITRDTGPFPTSGLYYKHVTIINYASSSIDKLKASLNDDARVIIYDRHMFIVQATGQHETLRISTLSGWGLSFCQIALDLFSVGITVPSAARRRSPF